MALAGNDKDLLRLKEYQGIRMLTVNEFLRSPKIGR
jgi:predicted nucleic acid-binding protein